MERFDGVLAQARGEGGRWIEVPFDADLAAQPELLGTAPGLRPAFDALAFTHRREYAEWVGGAKRPETRERRAAQAVERLRAGTGAP